jgi:hypothetical protein
MSMRTLFGGCACVALVLGGMNPSTASATTLFDLINSSGSISVGTLTFSGFSYLGTGDMPNSANVTVSAYTDPVTMDVGLKFEGSFFDSPTSGGSDALIDFQVAENDNTHLVTGATLAGDPSVTPLGATANGVVSVTETFLPTDPSLTLTIFASAQNGVAGPTQSSDSGSFATGHSLVFVQKDVLSFNADPNGSGTPGLTFITQTFHQGNNIPEPSTVIMLGTAMVGMALHQWRRRRS